MPGEGGEDLFHLKWCLDREGGVTGIGVEGTHEFVNGDSSGIFIFKEPDFSLWLGVVDSRATDGGECRFGNDGEAIQSVAAMAHWHRCGWHWCCR